MVRKYLDLSIFVYNKNTDAEACLESSGTSRRPENSIVDVRLGSK